MNKLFALFIAVAISFSTFATTYYVSPDGNDTTNDGLSWGTAFKTIGKARDTAADNDNIYVKAGTYNFTGSFSFNKRNYYGGFAGNETNPSERPLTDVDGNGIVEPWEFEHPTILSSTYNNGSTFTLPALATTTVNGFTFTHVATRTTAGTLRTVSCDKDFVGTFENNTIKDCVLSTTMTASAGGMLMTLAGVMKNCLFENNQTTCSSSADVAVMLGVEALINSKISNCVFRNNKATADWSSGVTANANLRGFVLNLAPSNFAADKNIVKNCLFYNNEAVFIGNATSPTSTNGAIVALSAFSQSASTDSIINCTFANNKATNMKTAGLNVIKTNNSVKYVINNVFWNNELEGNVKNLQIGTSLASGMISNNVMNGGGVAGVSGNIPTNTYCKDNLTDLSTNNTGDNKAPRFNNPSTVIGNSNGGSVEDAVWTLNPYTYLYQKGVTTTNTTDKAGVSFAATPSVGAYEYVKVTPTITWEQDLTELHVGGGNVTLTASSSELLAPEITYSSSNDNVITVSGNTLTIVGVGSATVTAQQASDAFYNAASKQQSVVVDIPSGLQLSSVDNNYSIAGNKLTYNMNGQAKIFSINGQIQHNESVVKGESVELKSGLYLVSIITSEGKVSTTKILIR